jgi:hypothetical protein
MGLEKDTMRNSGSELAGRAEISRSKPSDYEFKGIRLSE